MNKERMVIVGCTVAFALVGCFEGKYHPEGWEEPETHGKATRLQEDDCVLCHGERLEGGIAKVSCDSCHKPDWKTTCNYCHGTPMDPTGLPPRDLDGNTNKETSSFRAHAVHAAGDDHMVVDCAACHADHKDVLSKGHTFDDTPGQAEVGFDRMNPEGIYTPAEADGLSDANGVGSCSNLYCHGTGRAPSGVVLDDNKPKDCTSCHGGRDSSAGAPLGGAHRVHLGEDGVFCNDCHADVVDGDALITMAPLHVNSVVEVAFAEQGMTFVEGDECSGTCHNHDHDALSWREGAHHPPEWSIDLTLHGTAAKHQVEDCNNSTCHGTDLTGGDVGVGCDNCHNEEPRVIANGGDWRVDCNYCHQPSGGLRFPNGIVGLNSAFEDHEAHVPMADNHNGFDCVQCHTMPENVLSSGHMFDNTPGRVETNFTQGLSPRGVYNATNGRCSDMYCHGNGRGDNGTHTSGDPITDCHSCHADSTAAGRALRNTMSGEHSEHLGEGVRCHECHSDVTNAGLAILNAGLHVNGEPDIHIVEPRLERSANERCSGTCHGEDHRNESW